jgi:hypothetical protein
VAAVLREAAQERRRVAGGVDVGRHADRPLQRRRPGPLRGRAEGGGGGCIGGQRGEVDGGARREEAVGQFGCGLVVGEHRGEACGLVVGGGTEAEGTGQHREHGHELAAALDGEQPEVVRPAERVRPRAEPAGAHER